MALSSSGLNSAKAESQDYPNARYKFIEINLDDYTDYTFEKTRYDQLDLSITDFRLIDELNRYDILSIYVYGKTKLMGINFSELQIQNIEFVISSEAHQSNIKVIIKLNQYKFEIIDNIIELQQGLILPHNMLETISNRDINERNAILRWLKHYPKLVSNVYNDIIDDLMLLSKLDN